MNYFRQLPQHSKQLLRAMDHRNQLNQLDCVVCIQPFNDTNKKPIIKCSDNTCAYGHVLCQQCLKDYIQVKKRQLLQVVCPFCKRKFNNTSTWGYHQSRLEFIKKLHKLIQSIRQINIKAIKQNEQQYDKKINDIVEKADKQIFKINIKNQQKLFLLNRMKKRIHSFQTQTENKIKQLLQRQQIVSQRQKILKKLHQEVIKNKLQLQNQLEIKQQIIKNLTKQVQKLQQKLNQNLQVQNIDRMIRKNNPKESLIYNEGYYYKAIKFRPYQNSKFILNFRNVNNVIQLKKQRKEQLRRSSGDHKFLYHHHHMLDAKQDKLICFRITSINKNISQYKFGLAVEDIDSNYREVKGASLSIDVSSYVQKEELQQFYITFYVNMINMRLYARCGQFRLPFSDLPKNVQLKKYTFYVYFTHLQTQIKFT